MRRFDRSVCRNLDVASRREWLKTDGLGGFASSTIARLTRRYRGLLVAATRPPVGRMVLLSKVEETLVIDGRRVEFSCDRYPGVVHPAGHLYLVPECDQRRQRHLHHPVQPSGPPGDPAHCNACNQPEHKPHRTQ